MDVFEAIQRRMSIRKYKQKPIPDELIERILDIGKLEFIEMDKSEGFSKGYKYIFTPFMAEQDQVNVFLDVLDSIPENQRLKRIAYFQIMEEWGVATGRYLKQFAKERGYQIVTFEQYAMRSNDFSSLIVNKSSRQGFGKRRYFTLSTLRKQKINWIHSNGFVQGDG